MTPFAVHSMGTQRKGNGDWAGRYLWKNIIDLILFNGVSNDSKSYSASGITCIHFGLIPFESVNKWR